MVWGPVHTGEFLDHVYDARDRLYALYHLVAYRGLRRGEVCGLHWTDVDLDAGTLIVRWQNIQLGWATHLDEPKADASEAAIALDKDTIDALRKTPRPATTRPPRRRLRS
jgi:integrase